jgi:hypothetical protein
MKGVSDLMDDLGYLLRVGVAIQLGQVSTRDVFNQLEGVAIEHADVEDLCHMPAFYPPKPVSDAQVYGNASWVDLKDKVRVLADTEQPGLAV